MAHRKAKAAPPRATPHNNHRRRHARKTGWLPKAAAQAVSTVVAPLPVGPALQCARSHDLPQTPLPQRLGTWATASTAAPPPHGPTSQATTSYKAFFADQAPPTPDGLPPVTP